MKRYILALLVTLLSSRFCFGEGPNIRYTTNEMDMSVALKQPFDLWVESDGPWYLLAQTEAGLKFCDRAGQVVQRGQIAAGVGPEEDSHMLEVYFDLPLLGVGNHRLDMQVTLEGAQGILGLPLATERWILPLNSDQVEVYREGQDPVKIASGEWFLLYTSDRVFYGEKEVLHDGAEVESAGVHPNLSQTGLWWDNTSIRLDTGEWETVMLTICGPNQGGELVLGSNANCHLGDIWVLEGRILECVKKPGGSLALSIPALGPGVHQLTGSVQALLPLPGGEGEIWALWQDRMAQRALQIDRGWFDYDGLQTIPVDTSSPLVMPSGSIHHSQGYSEVTVQDGALDVIIPLDNPSEPIWTGLPLLESTVWSPDAPTEIDPGALDFFLPIFLWDEDFSWRLLASSGPWFLDATAERQHFSIMGKAGTMRADRSPDGYRATFSSRWPSTQGEGSWQWWQTSNLHQGTYNQGKWLWTLDIPREQDQLPSLAARYSDKKFGIYMAPHDLSLRISLENWSWGTHLEPLSLWLETENPPLRLEVGRRRARLDYKPQDQRQLKLEWDTKGLQLDLLAEPWEAYLSLALDGPRGGVRYRQAYSQGSWLAVTKGGLQMKNRLLLAEMKGQLGYVLGHTCTVYMEGILNASFHLQEGRGQMNFRYGGGLIARPLPQLVTLVGWDSEQQWHLKIGVALPFVGRNSSADFE
ncbi:MAG TPA: hypothetical protein VJZ70_01865 [Limnochordia bacterium]|nr:hypothetical protein [Limnochordia bacterium]